MRPNPKSEYRNPKQTQMTKIRNEFRKFENSNFEFVSDFGFRASNLTKNHLEFAVGKRVR